MHNDVCRRRFLETTGAVLLGGTAAIGSSAVIGADPPSARTIKILAISTSPRKGKTTAAGLKICLEAAKAVDPERIETELIELADLSIPGGPSAGLPLSAGEKDDFPTLLPRLTDPKVAGIIIGTPVYFGNMSYLCTAFLDRCIVLRKSFAWSNKVGGVLAVGGARNGGQEQTLRAVHTALFAQEMVLVGDGRPTAHCGATLWNDNFLIPIGSTRKTNAETLINYYYEPEVAAEVAAWVNYITPVEGAKEALPLLGGQVGGHGQDSGQTRHGEDIHQRQGHGLASGPISQRQAHHSDDRIGHDHRKGQTLAHFSLPGHLPGGDHCQHRTLDQNLQRNNDLN